MSFNLEKNLHFSFGVEAGGQSEIANFDRHVLREEHVAQLEITVNDSSAVDVAETVGQLAQVKTNFGLRQRFTMFHHVH
jgi:hypothetical protein